MANKYERSSPLMVRGQGVENATGVSPAVGVVTSAAAMPAVVGFGARKAGSGFLSSKGLVPMPTSTCKLSPLMVRGHCGNSEDVGVAAETSLAGNCTPASNWRSSPLIVRGHAGIGEASSIEGNLPTWTSSCAPRGTARTESGVFGDKVKTELRQVFALSAFVYGDWVDRVEEELSTAPALLSRTRPREVPLSAEVLLERTATLADFAGATAASNSAALCCSPGPWHP
mmetsp:Transcript_71738/g.199039  ORF Transcript_71738/g.199039 Transcript_71738/m.199039 type:complete len:228 (-) Transcript_71738:67-750(-)